MDYSKFLMGILPVGMASILSLPAAAAAPEHDNALQCSADSLSYRVEAQSSFSDGASPLWLNANRYGLSSVKGDNGYFRAGVFSRPTGSDRRNWSIGYGLDLAVAYDFTNTFTLHQLYADFRYKKVQLSVGSKERPMAFKNQRLSSGSQTFGINARPIPEVRIEIPEYLSITGKSDWAGIKGHFGYGMMTDGNWQQDYVVDGYHYAKNALYHSKAAYLRIGNEEKFPLVIEGGVEMACQFGGTIYNPVGREGATNSVIKMGHSFKDFFKAIYGGGSDATDEGYANAKGNTLGSWLFAMSYKGKDWKVRAYYDHFFEDHSQMFFEYGWLDGMVGVELTLPKNPVLGTLVYEYLNTTYQSGPVYHDHTADLPDQISGIDNYYNHNLYQGWQHWGQAIGNPLYHSPLYRNDGTLEFSGNRFRAHHIGLAGRPAEGLAYRLLFSHSTGWGSYALPFADKQRTSSFLCEVNYDFRNYGKIKLKGWSVGGAFAFDRSHEIGNHTGAQITIRKTGLLTQ